MGGLRAWHRLVCCDANTLAVRRGTVSQKCELEVARISSTRALSGQNDKPRIHPLDDLRVLAACHPGRGRGLPLHIPDLRALQRLALALLVHAPHQRALRWIQIQLHHVAQLLDEQRIGK